MGGRQSEHFSFEVTNPIIALPFCRTDFYWSIAEIPNGMLRSASGPDQWFYLDRPLAVKTAAFPATNDPLDHLSKVQGVDGCPQCV